MANELFTEVNQPPTLEQIKQIQCSARLEYVFGDLSNIAHPETKNKKYILNDIITAIEKKEAFPVIEPF